MSIRILSLPSILCACLLSFSNEGESKSALQEVASTPLTIKRNYRNTYPLRLASKGNAAVVEVISMIDENGDLFEESIVRSTTPEFDNEAITAVKRTWFAPATYKGRKVSSRHFSREYFLPVDRRSAVTPGFVEVYEKAKAIAELENPDREELRQLIDSLHKQQNRNFYAINQIQKLEVAYSLKFDGDWEKLFAMHQFLYFEQSLSRRSDFVDSQTELNINKSAFDLSLGLFQLVRAKFHLDVLQELLPSNEHFDYQNRYDSAQHLASQEAPISLPYRLDRQGKLLSELTKREFAIFDVNGEIEAFKLYCDRGFLDLVIVEGQSYMIPVSWGGCDIFIEGEPRTEFIFVQQ